MPHDKLSSVLRILDNENHLLERADQKAVSLLSILGVFMVFFIVYYRLIPVNALTVTLTTVYFLCALASIVSLIFTLRPRIEQNGAAKAGEVDKSSLGEPAFFAGISQFPNLDAYKESLGEMFKDESTTLDVYIRQIYSVAHINAAKYSNLRRATLLVIITLVMELAIIAYLFISHLGSGDFPPLV